MREKDSLREKDPSLRSGGETARTIQLDVDVLRSQIGKVTSEVQALRESQQQLGVHCSRISLELNGAIARSRLGPFTEGQEAANLAESAKAFGVPYELAKRVAETIEGHVRSDAVAASRQANVEFRIEFEGRINELLGFVMSVDRDQTALRNDIKAVQSKVDSRLAEYSALIESMNKGSEAALQKAVDKVESKLATATAHRESARKELDTMIHKEVSEIERKHEASTLELHRQIRAQEEFYRRAQAEKATIEENCARLMDECRASLKQDVRALEEDVASLRANLDVQGKEAREAVAVAVTETQEHLDAVQSNLDQRVREVEAASVQRDADLGQLVRAVRRTAEEAVEETVQANRRLQERFDDIFFRGSQALKGEITSLAQGTGEYEDFAGKAHTPEEWESAFYALVARQALDVELRAMVDRAVHRLQRVSDDIAKRSQAMQDRAAVAEKQLLALEEAMHKRPRQPPPAADAAAGPE